MTNIVIASAITIYSILGMFIMISWCQVREEFQPNGQHVLDFNEWPNQAEKIFFTGASIRDWRMVAWLFLWTTTCFGSIAIVIWCEKRIMNCFGEWGSPTSFATRKMHKEFHRALLAMAICPLVTTTVPLFYYLFTISFQLRSGQISAIMTTATTYSLLKFSLFARINVTNFLANNSLFTMALEIHEFHHSVDTTVNTLSILFNCYLLYLIKYHSTFGVKMYQYMLAVDAALDLGLSVATLLAQPVPLTGNLYCILISNGFFADRSPTFDSFTLILFCFLLHLNIIWIPIQFVYRYLLLCKQNISLKKANALIAAIAIGYSALMLALIVYFVPIRANLQPIGHNILELNGWPKSDITRKFAMVRHAAEWCTILWVACWSFTSCASISIVIWCEKGIVKTFKQMGDPTNANTQRMHKEFHRALLAMAICPLITLTLPVLYFCLTIATGICTGRVSVIMAIVLTSITVFNPLTTIVCFRCYRQVTARGFLSILTCGHYTYSGSVKLPAATGAIKSNSQGATTTTFAQQSIR
ncbi:serpentine type 7TM GPCR chemoreceptor srd domain-containing protein [Ditylenchus destructor]|uniref:Serpentine type 7TM GPCR chemoreceptor srd domain-containing protein n=1 Tax=Ditylenchus destructor TaxID=166010 RepID=A0AAD4MSA8_9BILA|nr:serpentine type 7TM GPCR chemoreceptor srd domain-containing protein [Ditylenchus destructor]